MDKEYYEKISTGTIGTEDFVKKSFEFLLKRGDKDSILKEFNIKQIKLNWCEYCSCAICPSHLIRPSSTLISAKCVFVRFAIALQSMQSGTCRYI